MKNFYYIETHNGFDEIIVFTSKKSAVNWCKKATCWTDEQIEQNIKWTIKIGTHFPIFPTKE